MTVGEGLRAINEYPIKVSNLQMIATLRGLNLNAELNPAIMESKSYKLATADVYKYLAFAPNVSQGGVSVSFSEAQRNEFLSIANGIYAGLGEEESKSGVIYGYKGSDL